MSGMPRCTKCGRVLTIKMECENGHVQKPRKQKNPDRPKQ